MASLDNRTLPVGDSSYYDPAFRRMIEDHLVMMRNDINAKILDVPPEAVYKFNGNFYQLLVSVGTTEMYLHWIIMRLTGLKDPTDPISDLKQILLPNITFVNQLMSVFKQTGTKIS